MSSFPLFGFKNGIKSGLVGKGIIHRANGNHRKYPDVKLQENIDSEIMEVLLQEAKESYDEEIVVELQSVDADEMESNVERVEQWLEQWKKNNEP